MITTEQHELLARLRQHQPGEHIYPEDINAAFEWLMSDYPGGSGELTRTELRKRLSRTQNRFERTARVAVDRGVILSEIAESISEFERDECDETEVLPADDASIRTAAQILAEIEFKNSPTATEKLAADLCRLILARKEALCESNR